MYIRQAGNSTKLYRDGWLLQDDKYESAIIESGGFLKKGERLLVRLYNVIDVAEGSPQAESYAFDGNDRSAAMTFTAIRTVDEKGLLGYRKGSFYNPTHQYYSKLNDRSVGHRYESYTMPTPVPLAYTGYGSLEEIRHMVPYWVRDKIISMNDFKAFDMPLGAIWNGLDRFKPEYVKELTNIMTGSEDRWTDVNEYLNRLCEEK